MLHVSVWRILKFRIPQRKVGACHKPSCLQKQFRHSEPFISVGGREVGTLLKYRFPDVSQGPAL